MVVAVGQPAERTRRVPLAAYVHRRLPLLAIATSLAFGSAAQDDSNPRDAYGNADFDARHVLQFDYIYQLPTISKLPVPHQVWLR